MVSVLLPQQLRKLAIAGVTVNMMKVIYLQDSMLAYILVYQPGLSPRTVTR